MAEYSVQGLGLFLCMENKNAKQWPKIKTAKFLTAGLVSYKDVDAGIALLKNETINAGLATFAGKPVIIDHADVTPKNYEKYRKGNVVSARFNAADGWYYVDFIVDDDEAIDCIENKGYSVSCAYDVLDVGDGGLYQDIPYDGEITKISFTHLALVTDPRYEESKILDEMPLMLVNSKIQARNITQEEGQTMFLKLFKKNSDGKQEEAKVPVLVNGKEVLANVFIDQEVVNEKEGAMDKKELYQAKDDDIVDINGHKTTIGEMKNAFIKMNEKADADEKMKKDGVEDKKNEKEEAPKKQTAEDKGEDKKGKPEEANEDEDKRAKKNSKEGAEFFVELEKAENSKDADQVDITASPRFGLTRSERANGWRDRVKNNIAAR